MTGHTALDEIRMVLESDTSVSADRVFDWMGSKDIEVKAAIVTLLSEYGHKVNPPLPDQTVFQFCLDYFKLCLLENPPEGEFVGNRTVEGHALQNWLKALWENREANSQLIKEIKETVTELYRSGDPGVRYAIETAFLEHLFENAELVDFFSDWGNDPLLKGAYSRAREWGTKMGRQNESP